MSTIKRIYFLGCLFFALSASAQVCKIFVQDINRFFSAGNKTEKIRVVRELKARGVTLSEDEIYKMLEGSLTEKQWNQLMLKYADVSKAELEAGPVKLTGRQKEKAQVRMRRAGLRKNEEVAQELNDYVNPAAALQPGYRVGDGQVMAEIRQGYDRHDVFRKELAMEDRPQNFASAEVHLDFGGGNAYTDRVVAYSGPSKLREQRRVIRRKAKKAGQKGDRIEVSSPTGKEHWLVLKNPSDGHGLQTHTAFGIDRAFDSEVKIFGHIVNECKKTKCDPEKVTGKIIMFSDYTMCPSCSTVVAQFKRRFPNVEVVPLTGPNHGKATQVAHGIEKGGERGPKVPVTRELAPPKVEVAPATVTQSKPQASAPDVYGKTIPEDALVLHKTEAAEIEPPKYKSVYTNAATPRARRNPKKAANRQPAAQAPPKRVGHEPVKIERERVGLDEYELTVPEYSVTLSGRGNEFKVEFPEIKLRAREPDVTSRELLAVRLGVDAEELKYMGAGGMRQVFKHPKYPGKVFKVYDPLMTLGYPELFKEVATVVAKSGNQGYEEIIKKMATGTASMDEMRSLKEANILDEAQFSQFEMGYRLRTGRATPEDMGVFNSKMETFAKSTQYDLGVEKFLREDLKVNMAAFDRSEMAQELWRDGIIIQDEVKDFEKLESIDPVAGPKVGTGAWYSMNRINAFDDQLGDIMHDRYGIQRHAMSREESGLVKQYEIKGFDKYGSGNFVEKDGELLIVDF